MLKAVLRGGGGGGGGGEVGEWVGGFCLLARHVTLYECDDKVAGLGHQVAGLTGFGGRVETRMIAG